MLWPCYRAGGRKGTFRAVSAKSIGVLMDQPRPRTALGRFAKGQPPPTGPRRRKGVPNKITSDIRRETIAGFARHGSNGRGEGGLAGFAFYLAKKHPKAAARLLEKVLPLTVNGSGLNPPPVSTIRIIGIPSGEFLSREDIDRLQHQETHTIDHMPADHVPAIEHHNEPAPVEEPIEQEFVPQTERERRLLAELEALTPEELLERAKQAGYVDVDGI